MMPVAAPFFDDVDGGPAGGSAHWLTASDGVRIRAGHWRPEGTDRGTVLLFPGRTEYIEKYGQAAGEFAAAGLATMAVDWRGQGIADRLADDRRLGHVDRFTDYQKDVEVVLDLARTLDLPRPWHLLGHSMGGAIGLRAAMDGAPFQSCAFTGPMWGIYMSPLVRPLGRALANLAPRIGQGLRLPPGTTPESYVQARPFDDNTLTTDREMFEMMQRQLAAHPELALGGPSLIWLREALAEIRELHRRPAPNLPSLTLLGENERIIDCDGVRARVASWPGAELVIVPGAEHEVMMEAPSIRAEVFARLTDHFLNSEHPVDTARSA